MPFMRFVAYDDEGGTDPVGLGDEPGGGLAGRGATEHVMSGRAAARLCSWFSTWLASSKNQLSEPGPFTIVGAAGLMAETTWRRVRRLGAIDARPLGGGERRVRSVDTNEDGRRGHWCTSATLASA
jgi:hypothetical protein